jgi:uncharacterized protein
MGWMLAGGNLVACAGSDLVVPTISNIANLGPLGEPDENGLRLPEGFRSRIVARSGQEVGQSQYPWHSAPDGGATFPLDDGGWIYVSNSESAVLTMGGASAIRFSRTGNIADAYRILSGTLINCAGGPTPWGTWLSCEEHPGGRVWECDPMGRVEAVVRPALGVFAHEAVAVDPIHQHLYLTEDVSDGRLYRFVPRDVVDGVPDLNDGVLEVARVLEGEEGAVEWLPLPDPSGESGPTRAQVPDSTPFRGGEGIWYHEGVVYFTTKGDDRVWAYDTDDATLTILYDPNLVEDPILSGVDNVVVSPGGDVLVAEDGGDMEIIAITPDRRLVPLVQVVGHPFSEVTGPAFDPWLQRLYFSSQRGVQGGFLGEDGYTFEVQGPFFI